MAVVSKATDISDSLARRKPVSDQLGSAEVAERDYIIAEMVSCPLKQSHVVWPPMCVASRGAKNVYLTVSEKKGGGTVKGWHHPVWKPSPLQWRHLQTLRQAGSVCDGGPVGWLTALQVYFVHRDCLIYFSFLLFFLFVSIPVLRHHDSLFFCSFFNSGPLLPSSRPSAPLVLKIDPGTLLSVKMEQWISSKCSFWSAAPFRSPAFVGWCLH